MRRFPILFAIRWDVESRAASTQSFHGRAGDDGELHGRRAAQGTGAGGGVGMEDSGGCADESEGGEEGGSGEGMGCVEKEGLDVAGGVGERGV
mmetsp:Transcript_28585/g.60078  ORF Transcript_28585/g.60078 Transcript_28585/m.60078 type:complete len:93 (-) Transcript_28585:479-757(-)